MDNILPLTNEYIKENYPNKIAISSIEDFIHHLEHILTVFIEEKTEVVKMGRCLSGLNGFNCRNRENGVRMLCEECPFKISSNNNYSLLKEIAKWLSYPNGNVESKIILVDDFLFSVKKSIIFTEEDLRLEHLKILKERKDTNREYEPTDWEKFPFFGRYLDIFSAIFTEHTILNNMIDIVKHTILNNMIDIVKGIISTFNKVER